MPDAQWLGEHGSVPMTEASLNKACLHTIAGRWPAHAAHISIRGDGHKGQSRDTKFRSAANLQGNDDVIAIEVEDTGPDFPTWNHDDGHEVPGFTEEQIVSIAEALAWCHFTHNIPLVPCPDSKDASEGIAYHRQGIDGNFASAGYAYSGRVKGGELWTEHFGKVCPGDRRITQLLTIIIPLARRMAGIDPPSIIPQPSEEAEVSKVWFVHGDSNVQVPGETYKFGDAVFMVVSDADGARRRHIHPLEWACLKADGAQVHELPQDFVDDIPWGSQPGLEPWSQTGGPVPGQP
jgi:hypothetical protein